ncbi:MAG: hypothetical protein QY332_14650 [Anaerolineales bacterium]|nr:MAG: hypothetical protein QY332_14650 [Anaerolineales bacterium]
MANKVFAAHSLIAVLGLGWALLTAQIVLTILFFLLALGGVILWLEWRNA